MLSFIATVAMQIANLATGVILARSLGPAGRGEIAALSALVLTITQLTGLSFPEALVYWLSRGRRDYKRFVGSGFIVAIAVGLIGVAALFLLAPIMHQISHAPIAHFWPWLLYPLAAQATHFYVAIARGMELHRLWAALRITTTANYAILLICFLIERALNVHNIGLALVGGQLLSIAFSAFTLRFYFRGAIVDFESIRSVFLYAVNFHPASFSWLAREQFDKVILFYLVPPADLGRYVVGIALGFIPMAFVTAIDQIIFPALVGLADANQRKAVCLVQMRAVAAVIFVGMIIMLPLTPLAINILFGSEYAVDVGIPTAAVAIGFLQSFKLVFGIGLKIEHRPGALGLNEMVGVVVTLVLMIPLVLQFGIYGAPLASAVGGTLGLSLTILKTKAIYSVPLRDVFLLKKGDLMILLKRLFSR